jgi:predicted ATPase/DNA-binding winged helix-turn-helix (wHTH) protein
VPAKAELVYEAGPWEIDAGRRELRTHGRPVPIGGRAFEIIEALAASAGQLVTKNQIIGHVWPGAIVGDNTLQVHISAIRKALGPDRAMLKTAPGRGYRLLGRWTSRQQAARTGPVELAPVRAPAEPVQGNLPMPASDLIGREAVVRHVRDLLSAYRVVTLTGPGGIGKSRLALDTARLMVPDFAGDVWLVELAALSDASLVAAAIASVLGLRLVANDISPEALARAIGGRKLLLVIDNCEHVIDAAATLVETLARLCPAASVLATSREFMRIEGECVYRVPPLDVPAQNPLELGQDRILEHSAIQLFIARMFALRSGFQHHDELPVIAAICRRLDGIPLAIEFAAAGAAVLGLSEVHSRLDDRFALLISGRRTALAKHRTLRATLDWSYELLSVPERRLVQRLAIFAAAFSLEAAIAVAGGGEAAITDISDGIANLVAKSLVTADAAGAAGRFRLLETTRAYAFEKLAEAGELPRVCRRHADYYRELLERIEGEREAKPASLVDLANVRAALEWCFGADGDSGIGVRLAAAAVPVFLAMSLLPECLRWSERALPALDDATSGGRAEMQLQAALGVSLMFTRGEIEAPRAALNRSLEIAEQHDDAHAQLRLLSMLEMFHSRIGDRETSLRHARRAATVSGTIADPAARALGHCLLGMQLYRAGDLNGARVELEAALHHGSGVEWTSPTYLGFDNHKRAGITLARTMWLLGYPAQALDLVRHAVDDAAQMDHPITLCVVLTWAVSLFFWAGELQSAEQHIDWLITRADYHSLGPYLAIGRGFRSQLAIRRGDTQAGVESLRGCLAELRAARIELVTTALNVALVQGLSATGRFGEAVALIDQTIRLAEANGDLGYLPELLRVKGSLLVAMPPPDPAGAETCFTRSLELSRRQGARAWELRTAVDLAALLAARGQPDDARALLRPVFEQFTEGFDTADLKAAGRLLASLG